MPTLLGPKRGGDGKPGKRWWVGNGLGLSSLAKESLSNSFHVRS